MDKAENEIITIQHGTLSKTIMEERKERGKGD